MDMLARFLLTLDQVSLLPHQDFHSENLHVLEPTFGYKRHCMSTQKFYVGVINSQERPNFHCLFFEVAHETDEYFSFE